MRFGYRFLRLLTFWLLVLLGRGRLFGLDRIPRRGGVILAVNHQSLLDPVLAALAIPRECHHMARHTLFARRSFARLIEYLNAFPVRRGVGDRGAIKEAIRRLRQGCVLLVFPEGTRTPDGRIGRLQAGMIAVARRAHCPIVPTAIEGAFDAWPRQRALPRPAPLWIEYGRPIPPETWENMEHAQAARYLTDRLRDLHNVLRRRAGRPPWDYNDPPCK